MPITIRARMSLVGKSVLLGLLASTTVLAATTIGTDIATDGRIDAPAHANSAGLKLPTNAGAPAGVTGTAEGDIVWNSTEDGLYVYNGSSFQQIGATPTTSLNQAYLNSTSTTELFLTSTQGALTIADTFSGTGNIFEVQDRTNASGDYSRRYLTVSATATSINAALTVTGNTTLGDASGDTITMNASTATIASTLNIGPNNALYINPSVPQVAIGTNTPADVASLQVHYPFANGSGIVITDQGSGSDDGNGMAIFFDSTANETSVINYEGGPIVWYSGTGDSEKARLTGIGNYALGTSNTDPRFNIRASTSSPTTNIFQISNSNDSTRYMTVSATATIVQNLTVNGTCTGCGTSTNLNQAYLGSTSTTELFLTPTQGALTIADTLSGTGNIFEVQNRTNASGDYSYRYFSVSATATSINAALTVTGNTTLGDASGDTLTINGTAVSIPNTLNIGSNALMIDASVPQVVIGTNVPSSLASLQVHYPFANGTSIIITDAGSGTTDGNGGVIFLDSTINQLGFLNYENGPITWSTGTGGASEKMRLSFSGNLALGTSNTDPRFNIRASTSSPTSNVLQISNSNDSSRYMTVSSTATIVQNLAVTGTCTGCATSPTLNQTYLAATGSPEISLTPSIGALSIADTFSGTGNIFEIQNRTNAAGAYSQKYLTVSATAVGIHTNSPSATLAVQHLDLTGGTILDLGVSGSSVFSVDHQGNIIGQRTLTLSRSAEIGTDADQFWPFPALNVHTASDFAQDLLQLNLGAVSKLVVKNNGFVGILTSAPSSELDVRDTSSVPTTNIFQVANFNDSTRYLTVSSTSTTIGGGLNTEDSTGSVTTNAVTVSTTAGVITDSTDINLDTTRAAITWTNTRITATSVVLASVCSTPDAGARLGVSVTPGAGAATITVYNSGAAGQTSDYKICFQVTN